MAEPVLYRHKSSVRAGICAHPPDLGRGDQAGAFQFGQMRKQCWHGYVMGRGQFTGGGRAARQAVQNGPPCRIGQSRKDVIELRIILSHLTKYL